MRRGGGAIVLTGEQPQLLRRAVPPAADQKVDAVGMLLTALHRIGLVALTHTPSPMGFLAEALGRPANERAFLNIPIGFPAEGLTVPDLTRKPRTEVLVEHSRGNG